MDPRLILTVLCAAAELFAFCRFVRARVHHTLPGFSSYLLAGFAQSFIWLAGSPRSHGYADAYGLTTPLIIGLQIFVFIELWRKLVLRYSGVDLAARGFGQAVIVASLVLGILSGVDGLALHFGLSRPLLFRWIFWGVRYSATVLCIACSLLALWASMFDRGLPRYLTRHAYLLASYFGSIAAGYLVLNLELLPAHLVGELTVGCAAILYLLWGWFAPGFHEDAAPSEPAKDDHPEDPLGWSKQTA